MKTNYNAITFHKRNKLLKERGFDSYDDFLKSDIWKKIKLKASKREHFKKCYSCGSFKNIQLHHLEYTKKMFLIRLTGIVPLCGICHLKNHELSRRINKSFKKCFKRIKKKYE